MKWQKERDDLIAQTKAFVQSVTGRTPHAVLGPLFNKAAPAGPAPAAPVGEPESENPGPRYPIPGEFIDAKSQGSSGSSSPPGDNAIEPVEPTIGLLAANGPAQSDVRKEIQARVAAFQAHQHRFHREREAYFNAVLTKARSAPENGSDVPSS